LLLAVVRRSPQGDITGVTTLPGLCQRIREEHLDSVALVGAVAASTGVEVATHFERMRQLDLEVDRMRTFMLRQCSPQNAISSSAMFGLGATPGISCTTALTSSPKSSFGTPNTAASATLGCVISRFSHSCRTRIV
jgi:hypothetical protein